VTLLAAKILLAPLCVVAVSLAGRRWGWPPLACSAGYPSCRADPVGRDPAARPRLRRRRRGRHPARAPAVSGALGPHLSGLLAPFPIITSVLAVFTHAHGGVARVGVLLRNFLFDSLEQTPEVIDAHIECFRPI
jgi:hypothetical protein